MNTAATVEQHWFRGEPAITLRAGELAATFVPNVGMTGVSLRYRGREHLALPGGLDALRAGRTAGLPLLAPWGNRLASRRYRAAGVDVDLRGLRLGTDDNGLPIHGLLVGKPGWRVDRADGARRDRATRARRSTSTRVRFRSPTASNCRSPPHEGSLTIDTTIVPTGRRRVPVAFGWHPYLRVPGTPRGRWRLRLPGAHPPRCSTSAGFPPARPKPSHERQHRSATRTFDDLYELGRGHRLAYDGEDGAAIELRCATRLSVRAGVGAEGQERSARSSR